MKFGYLSGPALDAINLTLPPDPIENARLLSQAGGKGAGRLHIGCAEYRVKEWKGMLYPVRIKDTDVLAAYIRQFDCMEMNGTHYRIYDAPQIAKWAEKAAGTAFRFLPKFPQAISHEERSFAELEELTAAFIAGVEAFRPHLGPTFLQMSERFHPGARQPFFRYLATLPAGYDYFVELRHPAWFQNPDIAQELFTALTDMGIGLVITDTPGRREIVHMRLTVPRAFIRFVGSHRHPSTAHRYEEWLQRLKGWLDGGMEEAWLIVHTGFNAPITARDIIRLANAELGEEIREPALLRDEPIVSTGSGQEGQ